MAGFGYKRVVSFETVLRQSAIRQDLNASRITIVSHHRATAAIGTRIPSKQAAKSSLIVVHIPLQSALRSDEQNPAATRCLYINISAGDSSSFFNSPR
jgi:hypothetical protein